ncbi:hemin uptake protein HemP [Tepidamorphus gemmatus]|jgi:hemin uptake protein HemP|uniref:Hemin uptake protein HemP n=1 Tax=Tepidamorphus gemmatus TaxID=747076 RepID=A0A4R3MAK2_9HYPH|nr:hemin uptake protein HemP [Tepidamorphus gemmatus]TCT10624.1 hemin uptake protein HemP [Tepidamorphus gemmatus]
MRPDPTRPATRGGVVPPEPVAEPVSLDSAELFRGAREVVIVHNRERYILRITRQGKLILNK